MPTGKLGLVSFAALLLLAPGVARAADGLDCMAQSYSAEELAEIDALSNQFSFAEKDKGGGQGDRLSEIGVKAAYECFDENGWSESALYYATLFELGRLSEAAYRQSGHLTAEQLSAVDEAQAGLENREAETTPQEDVLMGGFIISIGLGSETGAEEKVGELMGTMALQRIGRREFTALQEGE
jgi:hypothetical protein